ncbi:YiiX/YebB-like N1pC/P60 family cysteine hydrolase [Prevotella herbatica]|nr:YiiX/YebB-like N1pC/P60 family cysteine hydrolase [Prevotella herbatica]
MRRILIISLLTFMVMQGFSQITLRHITNTALLREGDLMFCASGKPSAITDVTRGIDEMGINHVAIFHKDKKGSYAIEAIHKGVCMNPINSFINANKGNDGNKQIITGRINCDSIDISKSIKNALKYIGRPYDFYFEPSDSAIYCSELVQISFVDHNGKLLFYTIPMSFHNKSGEITTFWKDYYSKGGMKVPEGAPGSNPGELSREKIIKMLYIIM